MRLGRFRWWHIDEVLPIEADLFGAEQWSAAMFWNELANGHFYLVATDDDGAVLGYAGLAVSPPDEAWVQNVAVRRDAQRRGIGRLLLEALLAEAARRGARSTLWRSPPTTRRRNGSTPATASSRSAYGAATTNRATPTRWSCSATRTDAHG